LLNLILVIWDSENNCESFKPTTVKSNDFDLYANGTQALSVNYNGKFYIVDLIEKKNILEGEIKGDPQRVRALNKKEKSFVILTKETLSLFENGALAKEVKLPQESQALEVNEVLDEIYVGDDVIIFPKFIFTKFNIILNLYFFNFLKNKKT